MMASATDADMVAGARGEFIFSRFLPAYDGTAAFVHLLGLLAATGMRLSKAANQAPRVHVAHEQVPTPWEQKGLVMRTLLEQCKDEELVLVDGIKVVRDDGWVLVLPDPEEPVTHVWAEAGSDAEARATAQEHARRIRQLLR
jgi:mannose-1-phosphate guanylyltransferase/phosphomannomutase